MKMRFLPALTPLLAAAACATAGGGSSDADMPLAWTMPEGASVTYVQSDTVDVDVDAGGQMIQVKQTQSATLGMTFEELAEGVQVTATFLEFDGRVDNPMAGQQRFTADAIDGPLVLTLTARGEATVVTAPEISAGAQALVNPETLAASFFPRLPDRMVATGDSWTDTVRVEAEAQGGVIRIQSALRYTVRGDTVVDGQTLLRVDFTSDEERSAEVSEAGMDVVQDVTGRGEGHFLWDRTRNRLHSQYQKASFTGIMEVPGAPFPLGLTIEGVSRTRLAGG